MTQSAVVRWVRMGRSPYRLRPRNFPTTRIIWPSRLPGLEEHAGDLDVAAHHLQGRLLPLRLHLAHGDDADLVQQPAEQVGALRRVETELETAVGADGAAEVGRGLLDEVVDG